MQFPPNFLSSVKTLLKEEASVFLSALEEESPTSIRLNPLKSKRNPLLFSLETEAVKWSDFGYYLAERPSFTFDPLFHAGYYYVQEAASMFVEYVAKELIKQPARCLDLCAAPGGKTVSLLSALPEGSLIVSNEIIRQRANVLAETITKFGSPNVVVTNNAPKDFAVFSQFFDVILVDAPCSGEGMFRKDEVAVQEWSSSNVSMCATRQKEILRDVWAALKPGGLLIYSTCTYNTAENEENARWIACELGAEFVSVEIKREWGISSTFDNETVGYRFFPHKTKGEGLFVTALRKLSSEEGRKQKKNTTVSFLKDASIYHSFLKNPENFDFFEQNNRVTALPKGHSETFLLLCQRLKCISMGIDLGERKGNDFIPSHALAMSAECSREFFSKYEISYPQAIAYLRREAIVLENAPKGFLLLTFKNEPLGFVKNIGTRANNLYPPEWRIRSGYLPETIPEIFFSPLSK